MDQVSLSFTNNGSSSQIQQQRPSTANSFSIELVESSIRNLLRSWYRRQRWKFLFNSTPPQDLDRAPWRTHLASFLESTPVHAVSLGLLVIDLIFTILELSSSLLATSCRPKESHYNATEEIWYHWVGIAILSLLSAKTIALAVGLGTTFLRRPGYVIDGIVLIGALVLEVFLEKVGGGLLVVVSLWRVVRLVESAFELSDEAIEAQIEGVVYQFEMLREENRKLLITIAEKDQIIQKLQEDLDQCICHSGRKFSTNA
ncbi:PREDICTED: voltage-gated hydrogen channel 1-like [Fragaria vesca subsp. vesca]